MLAHWHQILSKYYRIDAELERLDGEYDLNFLARGSGGSNYILKVMRKGCDPEFINAQIEAYEAIHRHANDVPVPEIITAFDGEKICTANDEEGRQRLIWVMKQLPGVVYAEFRPQSLALIEELGRHIGAMDHALEHFDHPQLERQCKWNLLQADWISDHMELVETESRIVRINAIVSEFEGLKPELEQLPAQALHNDVNDYNILVQPSPDCIPHISGIIDLGDMIKAPRICELAIAGAYVVLDHETPQQALAALVKGYHSVNPLNPDEVRMIVPLLEMRLAVSVVNSTLMAQENPEDPYVTISQAPAWRYLERADQEQELFTPRLLAICDMPVTPESADIHAFLKQNRGSFAPVLEEDLTQCRLGALSVAHCTTPQNPFDMQLAEAALVGREYDDGTTWLGYYNEPRLVYTDKAFRLGPWKNSSRRSVHLGVDVFAPAGRAICAPLEARVEVVEYRAGHLDYGGMVILSHETDQGTRFYTLYGHLMKSVCDDLKAGQSLKKGERFASLGTEDQNGGWAPHLHFQLAMTMDGMGFDWPGVADPDQLYLWNALCPNPAALLNLEDEQVEYQPLDRENLLAERNHHFGANVRLSYRQPVLFLRGWKHHLFDEMGRPYLDAYNNVPHVGHAHPRIQKVAAEQLKRMNSNTRYLHPAQTDFARKIADKMPEGLDVCFFVNSGTEANELALRLARAYSGGKHMITPDHGYHGNTTGAIDISAYKFNKPGGVGQSDWVHLIDVADDYKGLYLRDDPEAGRKYADQIDPILEQINEDGGRLAGFIAETFPSVGGQIIPPEGYLLAVYEKIRDAGGLCIADEVQTGLGRLGEYYFGFEQQQVVPDIVVLGKPIGNGHPLGVLVTTREIADRFDNGIEYFSTFGGSNLSCLIGKEVLDIVDDEGLQTNATEMGNKLMDGLLDLKSRHPVIGDVRGMGLFLGVELVQDRKKRNSATELASYVVNRLRENRVLIGVEGPDDNVLKIRPPLTLDEEGAEALLYYLDQVLSETVCLV